MALNSERSILLHRAKDPEEDFSLETEIKLAPDRFYEETIRSY